jgi:hypothetical protein
MPPICVTFQQLMLDFSCVPPHGVKVSFCVRFAAVGMYVAEVI